jgi:uncharacterized protein YcbX
MAHDSERVGTLAAIWRYPVKSLRGEALEEVFVDGDGLAGDRRHSLRALGDDRGRRGKDWRGKEDQRLHLFGDASAAIRDVERRGIAVALNERGPNFDDSPVSVLFDAWLAELNAMLGRALEPLRFRPNLFVRATETVPPEAALVGATIAVGNARLRVVAAIERCVVTTYDLATGASDPAVLHTLAQRRANTMGVYCTVAAAGAVTRGGAVFLAAPTAGGGPPAPSPA